MSPTIRVDDDVMNKLKELAVEMGLVFKTPNEVLKRVLEIEDMRSDEMGDSPRAGGPSANDKLP